jgi:NAD(P)-dependent dehydrogenase (short-subunit alcohol dehydrogenase family)
MALAMAERGADVVVTSRKADACEEVAAEIEAMGRQAMAYGCHVGHWDEIDALIDAAYERFGKIDICINNAGMSSKGPFA